MLRKERMQSFGHQNTSYEWKNTTKIGYVCSSKGHCGNFTCTTSGLGVSDLVVHSLSLKTCANVPLPFWNWRAPIMGRFVVVALPLWGGAMFGVSFYEMHSKVGGLGMDFRWSFVGPPGNKRGVSVDPEQNLYYSELAILDKIFTPFRSYDFSSRQAGNRVWLGF